MERLNKEHNDEALECLIKQGTVWWIMDCFIFSGSLGKDGMAKYNKEQFWEHRTFYQNKERIVGHKRFEIMNCMEILERLEKTWNGMGNHW